MKTMLSPVQMPRVEINVQPGLGYIRIATLK